ncbi:hypothetical protein JCM3775_003701 [Rhodotorula graminis]
MSSTHTPQQPCPFDRLPNELLAKILHHLDAAVTQTEPRQRRQRRVTFLNVALLSRRFKALAANFQYRYLAVSASSELATLQRVGRDGLSVPARACRVFRLSGGDERQGRCVLRVDHWASRLPAVEEMSLWGISYGCLSQAAAFTNLRRLELHRCTFGSWSTISTTSFSRLSTLELHNVTFRYALSIDGTTMCTTFPSLRQVAVQSCELQDLRRRPLLPVAFVAQLDALGVDLGEIHLPTSGILPLDDLDTRHAVLWRCDVAISDSTTVLDLCVTRNVVHVFIKLDSGAETNLESQSTRGHDRFRLFIQLYNLVDHLPHLRLLLVPPSLWNHVERLHPYIMQCLGNFKNVCQLFEWRREQAQAASGTAQG